MKDIMDSLVVFLPVIAAEWILAIAALVHVLKHPKYKFGNKIMWILIVLFIQFIGPIVYFTVGRGEE